MKKYLDLTTWIILFALLPFTVLIFLSQGSGPGDLFYPIKRGMENIILAGASFSPATKVAFRTDLTERRFKEAEKLLLFQGQTTALTDFVGEVQITQEELFKLSSFEDKKELSDKLIAKIDEYEVKLAQVQTQIEQQPSQQAPQVPIQTPFQPTAQPQFGQTSAPTAAPATQPTPVGQIQTPVLVQQTPVPTATPKPFIQIPFQTQQTPVPTPAPILDTAKKEEVVNAVSDTREKLKEFKEKLKKDKEDTEVKEKIKEEQEKLRENLKENRRENGKGSGRNGND